MRPRAGAWLLWEDAQRRIEAAFAADGAWMLRLLCAESLYHAPSVIDAHLTQLLMTQSILVLLDRDSLGASAWLGRPVASNRLSAALGRRGIFYGWVVAGSMFLVMRPTPGAMGAPGVLIGPLEKEFGWSAADISAAFAIRLALYGMIAPFAAALINRFGVRAVVVAAIGMVDRRPRLARHDELWQLVALWGVLIGFGTGMVALVLGAKVAARWFHHRRGLVVGMLTASTATGQLVFLPLLAKLTQDYGWRAALVFIVVMLSRRLSSRSSSCATAPMMSDFRRRRACAQPPPAGSHAFGAMLASPLRALYEARASRTFWVLFATFFVCGLSTNGLIQTHWIALCGDYGVAPVAAAGALAAIGAFDFVGTIRRAGSPTASTTAGFCSSITGCAACR